MSIQLKGAIITMVVGFMFVALEFATRSYTSLAGIFILGVGSGLLLGDRMGKKPAAPTPPVQPL
ncbi:MAG: hypothetical protein HYV19_07545 [Gemmatimonadetes bacterium]|jgi:hypothetical protein|nr:hypothetical protein [Gemmatimonadota bacterium]